MKLNWLNKFLWIINILTALGLLLANFSASFEPNTSTIGYLWGMTYPLFLFLNLIFMLYWMYGKKLHFLLSLVIILLGYSNAGNLLAFNFSSTQRTLPEFTVMTFNVRLFNEYNWFEEPTIKDQIFSYIEKESPDIIAIQEFFESKDDKNKNRKRLKELGYKYYVKESNAKKSRKTEFFGLILFSKYKIVDSGIAFKRETSLKAISYYADININDQVVRVYNTHLNSLGFQSEDYKFVENISENSESEAIKKSKNILSKVMVAAKKRQEEVKGIKAHMQNCAYPLIVLGDFNEPPYSYAYPQFISELSDPFQKYGLGLGETFDGISTIPGLRLDYTLHSKSLNCTSYKVGPKNLSDHRAILTGFAFTE